MSTVYLQRFNLERQPFALLPDTDFFFEGERRGLLLQGLHQALRDDAGLCVVAGEVGTGKTMLCRMLGKLLQGDEFDVAFIPDASLPREALLAAIASDLGLPVDGPGGAALVLQQALLARSLFGQRLVLLIDEAHTLRPEALDAVRMLMNVETGQCKLLQIVLFGQPELHALLRRPDLRQVRDRITHTFELAPLSRAGAQAYLEHRLRTAGWRGEKLLEPDAVRALVARGAGRFRALGLLADKALLAAYSEGARSVAAVHVMRAWHELQRPGLRGRWQAWAQRLLAPLLDTFAPLLPARPQMPALPALPGLATFTAARAGAVLGLAALAALAVPLGQRLGAAASAPALKAQVTTLPRVANAHALTHDFDALLRKAPPAAAALSLRHGERPSAAGAAGAANAAAPYFTLQLASVPSQALAQGEQRRLEAATGVAPLFVLYRPGRDASKPPSAAPWVVCTGRYTTAQAAAQAQARLGAGLGALRPRILKVDA